MIKLGLIGKNLSHSFSKKYFQNKFKKENIDTHSYELIELQDLTNIKEKLEKFAGFNVTFPYKQEIINYLDELDPESELIGAVNLVKLENGKFKGYNTDSQAFLETIKSLNLEKALILGSGGASKAVEVALKKLNIKYLVVSRNKGNLSYNDLNQQIISDYKCIINTTPLGTFPNMNQFPEIPYQFLTDKNFLYDLIYNPEETLFLKKGKEKSAKIKNGLEMLHRQAELSWKIWNN